MFAEQRPDASTTSQTRTDPQLPEAGCTPWRSGPLAGLLFGLLGGLLAFLVIQASHPWFAIPEELLVGQMTVPDALQRPVNRNNTMSVLAILGGAAAGALAVGEGLCRRSWRTALAGGAACALLGAALGCLAGYLGFIAMEHYEPRPDLTELAKPKFLHQVTRNLLRGLLLRADGNYVG